MRFDEFQDILLLEANHCPGFLVAITRTLPADAGDLPPLGHLVDQWQRYPQHRSYLFGVKQLIQWISPFEIIRFGIFTLPVPPPHPASISTTIHSIAWILLKRLILINDFTIHHIIFSGHAFMVFSQSSGIFASGGFGFFPI